MCRSKADYVCTRYAFSYKATNVCNKTLAKLCDSVDLITIAYVVFLAVGYRLFKVAIKVRSGKEALTLVFKTIVQLYNFVLRLFLRCFLML